MPTIIRMVNHTRLDCLIGSAAGDALGHGPGRPPRPPPLAPSAAPLVEQPAMRNVLADLAIESEAATATAMRVARAYDEDDGAVPALRHRGVEVLGLQARAPARRSRRSSAWAATASWRSRGCRACSATPRSTRSGRGRATWPRSTCCARWRKEPEGLPAFLAEVELARGANARLDAHVAEVKDSLAAIAADGDPQWAARRAVEDLGLALQGSLLVRHAPAAVSDAFCAARLGGEGGRAFGTLPAGVDAEPIVERVAERVTETLTYEVDERIARITLDRPERGNGITLAMPRELAECVERANLDPAVHVIALAGNGKGFCGGYDLVESAEGQGRGQPAAIPGSPLDPAVEAPNHDPSGTWDPVVDYQMMSRNLRGFMSLFHSDKPVVCKVHGFCVAGGTDMALCSDLLVIADGRADRLPARARLGRADVDDVGAPDRPRAGQGAAVHRRPDRRPQACEWGLALERAPPGRAGRALRGAAAAHRPDAGQPAGDDEAAGQPGAVRPGPARHAGPGHGVRRRGPPHARGLRLPARARPRRAARRPCASATSPTGTPSPRANRC